MKAQQGIGEKNQRPFHQRPGWVVYLKIIQAAGDYVNTDKKEVTGDSVSESESLLKIDA